MKTLKKVDEKEKSSFWYGFATNYIFTKNKDISPISASDNIFLKQAKAIEELYEKENCIIIGRCSDYILKNQSNVIKLFIYASDIDFKIKRKMKYEHISKSEAVKKIQKIDKERAEYYTYFTTQKWGDKSNYDISIDSSKIGIEETINMLENYIKMRIKQ